MRHIFLTGGGTLGSVTPLLALVEAAREQSLPVRFTWVGTRRGPEVVLVHSYTLPYHAIVTAKWRRYFDWRNFFSPFLLFFAFGQSVLLVLRLRPDVVVSTGAYTSVPVAWAAWTLRIPVVLHEQDIIDGLANRLMRPVVNRRTTVWDRPGAETIGNPSRPSILRGSRSRFFEAHPTLVGLPVIYVTGGGTGSVAINTLVASALPKLLEHAVVIHLTGSGKRIGNTTNPRYITIELAVEHHDLLAAADVVVTRAGMATLSDLAASHKPAIVIPLPGTQQEANAQVIQEAEAGIVVDEATVTAESFVRLVRRTLEDKMAATAMANRLAQLIPNGTNALLDIVMTV
ncbi:MAG: UDP-N-acetylglucosamine--N-acetylmuramyl-(pentapeptide) pyrophosphoryl-undecaprenol N-acetylglucosamine transferase [Patescibacteria group bacterium]